MTAERKINSVGQSSNFIIFRAGQFGLGTVTGYLLLCIWAYWPGHRGQLPGPVNRAPRPTSRAFALRPVASLARGYFEP